MAQFTNFQDILPDPNNSIGTAGQSTGTAGPGFASVKLTSDQPYVESKTNSGRLLARAIASHKWRISITYNDLTRAQFEPIYNFLLQRRGPMNPFYVSLPQYRTPQNANFATHCATKTLGVNDGNGYIAGTTVMTLDGGPDGGYTIAADSTPAPGDMFTIDGANSNHKKAYMVTRVETPSDYTGTAPASNNVRIHFVPGLAKAVVNNDKVVFNNPLIKVVRTGRGGEEYSLNTNNLYKFSLTLEEVQ